MSRLTALTIGIVLASGPLVSGHHSIQSQFNISKEISLRGQVAQVEWRQPHVLIRLSVTGEKKGSPGVWLVETLNPNALARLGVDGMSLKYGDVIRMNGYAARDGQNHAVTQSITLSDGRTIEVGLVAASMDQ
jgi:hypothetical protein